MLLLGYSVVLVFLTWLLVSKVRDGLTYLPIVGGGLGVLIGREMAALLGPDWAWLPMGLAAALFVAPYLFLIVGGLFDSRSAAPPTPKKRARLEAELTWEAYDPTWLVELARAQYQHDAELIEGLSACKKKTESGGRVYFIPPKLLSKRAQPIWKLTTDNGETITIYRTLWREVAAIGNEGKSGDTTLN